MPDYDFHTLSPVDFEELTRDLIQARDKIVLQSFKTGRDGGVDLRYAKGSANLIVQCKHFKKSGFNLLLREIKNEAAKLREMQPMPTRYILSTSVELSNQNKEKILRELNLDDTSDILGSNDLNGLLGLFSEVERRHYKLWLASTPVLLKVLHNAETTQSDFEFRRVKNEIRRFVQSKAYDQAAAQLRNDRILILSGLPGVGKTTLAEFLLYESFSKGYEPVIARNGLEEARTLYKEGIRQAFYYDDFLGATFLGESGSAFKRNEDRTISDFISMVSENEDKLLILTTREHILTQALDESERLQHSRISDFRYVISIGTYTKLQRARILYNHIHFSKLPGAYKDQLLHDDFYLEIIQHEKLTPRLIQWLTTYARVKGCPSNHYQDFVRRLLNDPSEIWQFAYNRQINHAGRSLLLALHSFGGRVSGDRLRRGFGRLHDGRAKRYGFQTDPGDFPSGLRILNGSFIDIHGGVAEFINPSVRDLMNSVLSYTPENVLDIIEFAVSMRQIQIVWEFSEHRNTEHLMALIEAEVAKLVDGTAYALATSDFSSSFSGDYSLTIEDQLNFLIEMTGNTNSVALAELVMPTIERAIHAWNRETPNFTAAVRAITALEETRCQALMTVRPLRLKLRSALMTQNQLSLQPSAVAVLLELGGDVHLSDIEKEGLRSAAAEWPRVMGGFLRDCKSSKELDKLGDDIRSAATLLNLDLRGPIQAVETEMEMYVEAQERHTDAMHDQWKEDYYEEREDRSSLRDMFDSLRHEND